MLIAEDLLLLLLDDETGALAASSQIQVALGGAVLAELAIDELVTVAEKQNWWRTAKVTARAGAPTDPVLAAAHAVVAEKERSASDLVSRLGKGLKDELVSRLVAHGMVHEEHDKALGLFARTRWPAASTAHEADVRRAVEDTLVRGLDPDPRTGALVALLSALDQAHRVVEHPAMSNGEVRKRAKVVAEGEWAAEGVRDAIVAANAAVVAAITAAAAASSVAST